MLLTQEVWNWFKHLKVNSSRWHENDTQNLTLLLMIYDTFLWHAHYNNNLHMWTISKKFVGASSSIKNLKTFIKTAKRLPKQHIFKCLENSHQSHLTVNTKFDASLTCFNISRRTKNIFFTLSLEHKHWEYLCKIFPKKNSFVRWY